VKDIAIFAGGQSSSFDSAVVDIYNVTPNTWTTSSLSQARTYPVATSVEDIAIFAGGTASSGYSAVVDIYNVTSNIVRGMSVSLQSSWSMYWRLLSTLRS
jgi:hypothetical protein